MEMLQIEDYAYDNVADRWAALSRTTVVTGNMDLAPWLFIIPGMCPSVETIVTAPRVF